MDAVKAAAALSAVNERIIEYVFAPLFEQFKVDRKWLLYVALATGLALSWVAGVDIMAGFGVSLAPPVNLIVSGFLVGGGSELLHQIIALMDTIRTDMKEGEDDKVDIV